MTFAPATRTKMDTPSGGDRGAGRETVAPLERLRLWHARWAPWAAVLATALLGVAAWLFWPRADPSAAPTRPPLRMVLVDASASVTRLRPNHSGWLRRRLLDQARAASESGEEIAVVVYGADVASRFGPGRPPDFEERLLGHDGDPWNASLPAGRDLESDLGGALQLAGEELRAAGRAAGRLVVLGDLGWTTADPSGQLASLARAGVHLERIPLPPIGVADSALVRLEVPERVEAGADLPFAVPFVVQWPAGDVGRDAVVELEAELVGEAGVERQSERLVLTPAARSADLALAQGSWRAFFPAPAPGRYRLEVQCRLTDHSGRVLSDRVPENDRFTGVTRVEGRIHTLVVSSESVRPELGAWLERARLAWPGVELEPVALGDLSSRLPQADLLLSIDLGPAALPARTLVDFVRRGGSWLSLGGWRALSGWTSGPGLGADSMPGSDSIRLETLLPIEPDPSGLEPRDVILLVDRSGSMAGEPFDRLRAALAELVLAAPPSDRVELRFFTGTLGPVAFESARGQNAAERERGIGDLLSATAPTGPTDILDSLERLLERRRSEKVPALVLLLTDGRTRDAPEGRAREVRAALAECGTQLRSIAVGKRATYEFLERLLLAGETIENCEDLSGLALLLTRELHDQRVRRQENIPVVPVAPPESQATTWTSELQEAWAPAFESPSFIHVLARGQVAPRAVPLWVTSDGDPVLAVKRFGRGWVASSTTSPFYGWAPLLEQAQRLEPLVRILGRGEREAREPRPQLHLMDERLVLQPVPGSWPAEVEVAFCRPELAGLPIVDTAEFGTAHLAIPARGWGGDPRRRREGARPQALDRRAAGAPLQARVSSGEEALATLFWGAPVPAELAPGGQRTLEGLFAELEGRVVEIPPGPDPAGRPHRAAVPILVLSLVLLFLSALQTLSRSQAPQRIGRQ